MECNIDCKSYPPRFETEAESINLENQLCDSGKTELEFQSVLRRFPIALFFVAGGLWLHELIQVQAEPWLMLDNIIDQAIPFIPWSIWIYFSFFPFIFWSVLRVERKLLWPSIFSCLFVMLIGWSCILLVPVSFERPAPSSIESSFYRWVFTFVHESDPSHISFPCLHVAVTWICFAHLKDIPGQRWRLFLMIAITISTLTTKQHLIIDVIAGLGLSWFGVWMTRHNYFVFSRTQDGQHLSPAEIKSNSQIFDGREHPR